MSVAAVTDDKEKFSKLQEVIVQYKGVEGSLIPVLQEAQEIFGALPLEVQKFISEALGVPIMNIYGIVTFYSQFTLKPKGKYQCALCMGTACYVRGAQLIQDRLEEALGIRVGATDDEGLFTLEAVRCVGACGLAPILLVNEDVYGGLNPDRVAGIIDKYRKS